MDIKYVSGLVDILERSSLAELEYLDQGMHIRLSKSLNPGAGHAEVRAQEVPVAPFSSDATPNDSPQPTPQEESLPRNMEEILSPLAGVFYRAPSPKDAPFVSVGDHVKEGQQLGIIEAMKMLNPVEAEFSGRIVKILVEDAANVEGQAVLFEIEKSGGES
ncbi:acetyl-CoA carboxylase biotin carboxyl carrier protein [Herbaspirillum sp. 1130]|uniref:acetyl-CoA carboxylase biotin carboxyl carrier protein n=1 Tax=Herbaspirillum sp. 1130 TaxID=2806562 RepID=UPI001AE5F40B|nr:acetyl-CoA carboxylase biotin carboxyl carrier protein [Herbaspirillum sp. 1130]MBP1318302.1 acetyl-CoA carboxylase biotin carboxyl carrier protein [Herbaspirillum sp. 1130]